MAHEPSNGLRPGEERQLKRLRIVAGAVVLAMVALLVIVDTLGRLFINPAFHADEVALGTLLGALLLIIGIEAVPRLPGLRK